MAIGFAVVLACGLHRAVAYATKVSIEPVQACVMSRDVPLNAMLRTTFAQCLGWQPNNAYPLCRGVYQPLSVVPFTEGEIRVQADEASLYAKGRSRLSGNVEVHETQRVVNAQTAYIYRDEQTSQVTKIELLGEVRYLEPDRLMIARKAVINPQDKSGRVEDVLYRFSTQRANAILPAWGRASFIERFANQDYLLRKATYSTCAPQDNAWQIEAGEISLDYSKSRGVAKHAILRVHDWPVLYAPYLSFPTAKVRKSGFLMPMYGYSNIGGFDLALPYYWNIAPNYDATLIPHVYTRRGLMMGGDFRFLTESSAGIVSGHLLPNDRAFAKFVTDNSNQYPSLRGTPNNRWSFLLQEHTQFNPNLHLGIDYQQVSDDYYLQDFSTNLAVSTQNQLLRQGTLAYTTEHWLFRGMMQSYQTLHPINQSVISDIYQRLPQLLARGAYNDLPFQANFNVLGQLDNFRWSASMPQPQGPRYHLNPILSFAEFKPWGYVTPSLQLVENYYNIQYGGGKMSQSFNRTIPRYSLDSGLFFERFTALMGHGYLQTLEPRLYYLYVPYHDQTTIPVFDSAYMIFNNDQLFRTNRFSGFDRIGDANQLAYAVTTRWLSEENGQEKASFSIGQIRYFSNRRVQLCYSQEGNCSDGSLMLGYLSPVAKSSPIASRLKYHLNSTWMMTGDYVWDVYTHATNNGYLNIHYQPQVNQIINFGYTYLVDGDVTQVANSNIQNNALHQATFSYAWPFSDRWSSLGIYSYNISKRYNMMTFLGLQYDNCCWAIRVLGGRTFKSISPTTLSPQYNNSIYLQILLKGLGSAASGDPSSVINSYLPGYSDIFRH
ncbi:LPS-assembly protein LptD [Legionella nagasakiensis]|uniref:LPS-assembly protein LptD n=1 Tax=Legionella nagasakiensis TaxID=535290 RepID=UPI0013EF8B96|nr:LPS-assembly protein LptD [Legionella nagasakiensis]